MLGQPLLIELLILLLEGFHAALEVNLQPLAAADGEESHTLRHAATFINTTNHVGEGLAAASAKIRLRTGHAVVVRNVAGTESELADAVVDGRLLKGIWHLVLHEYGLDNPFHILAPELRALFLSLAECNFLVHADNLHIGQCNNFVLHCFCSFLNLTLQGRCKPNALELALIAEAPPVLAVFDRKSTQNHPLDQTSGIFCMEM